MDIRIKVALHLILLLSATLSLIAKGGLELPEKEAGYGVLVVRTIAHPGTSAKFTSRIEYRNTDSGKTFTLTLPGRTKLTIVKLPIGRYRFESADRLSEGRFSENENRRVPSLGFTIYEDCITTFPFVTYYFNTKKTHHQAILTALPEEIKKYSMIFRYVDSSIITAYLRPNPTLEREIMDIIGEKPGATAWEYRPINKELIAIWPGNSATIAAAAPAPETPTAKQAEPEGPQAVQPSREDTGRTTQNSVESKRGEAKPADLRIVTVLDFEIANIPKQESVVLIDLLSSALFDTRCFRVLNRAQREAILQEIEFSTMDCVDEACQLEVGRMLASDYIVVGSLAQVGSRFIFNTRLIDVETGETAATSHEVFSSLDQLIDGIEGIARELAGI